MRWYSGILQLLGFGQRALPAPEDAAPVDPEVRASAELDGHKAGYDFAGYPAAHGFDPAAAAAARGRFTWVHATVVRKATDLARLPFRIQVGSRGRGGRVDPRHPMLALLEQPNSVQAGHAFWTQMHLDNLTTGSAYARKVREGGLPNGRWISMLRLAPQSVRVIPAPHGLPDRFEFNHGGVVERIPASEILHFVSPSWQDNPSALSGEGIIEPMQRDLATDWALQERSRIAAKQGRPAGILSPTSKDGAAGFAPKDVGAIREELQANFRSSTGGVSILGRPLEYTKLDYSPDELNGIEERKFIREGVLASAGVPPVRVGLETANYATAQQQAETYWGDELQGWSATFDDVLTLHARKEFGPTDLYVYRHFGDVPALMMARESAIRRASQHIINGADPKAAYEAEGLDPLDFAPPVVEAPAATPAAPAPKETPAATGASDAAGAAGRQLRVVGDDDWFPVAVHRDIHGGMTRAAGSPPWRKYVAKVHSPIESKFRRAMAKVLREQAARVADRAAALDPSRGERNLAQMLIEALFPGLEDAEVRAGMEDVVRRALDAGWTFGQGELERDVAWTPSQRDAYVDSQIGQLVKRVNDTTKAAIQSVVDRSIREGWATSELQAKLQADVAFAPSRALTIARTETTKAVSAGSAAAYASAADEGIEVELEWMAQPGARDAHASLDGQVVKQGNSFVIPDGDYAGRTARYPGDFGVAALDINCRCGVRPRVIR